MSSKAKGASEKKKFEFPHVLLLLFIMVMFSSLLTYIVPAGKFDVIEGTKAIDPSSFHFIEQTPISPLKAMVSIQSNLASGGLVISLLIFLGACTEVLVSCGAINSLVDTGIAKFKDKSIKVVIPMIYLLMTILGALCGNDSMCAYVAIGIIISKKLNLDRICAVSMFYLPYITAQAAGPTTAIILIAQEMLGIPPLSGAGLRIVIEIILYIIGATYTTMYALKINRDPSKSILGREGILKRDDNDQDKVSEGKFELRALLSVLFVIFSYIIYAYGASNLNWSWGELCLCILVSSVLIGIVYKMKPNDFCKILSSGAAKMGAVLVVVALSRTVSATLTNGNIIHTFAYYATGVLSKTSPVVGALGLFLFNLLFNFIVVGGTAQAYIVLPIMEPIGQVVGISAEALTMILQFGDGLTNCMTPLSGPLMASLALGGVSYPKWIKFVYKLVLVNVVVAALAITFVMLTGM